ncbi:dioxygenase family protein [Rhizobium sp. SL86]|uniref:dioxygenase family protein n=1 Tax=Rhizobium sp. SL86 TaxID=2995148 RepID=UPI00227645A4|nr:protocatechuate 3,4-dioxygenase [Rhizobium sp. SL86]MCY1667611.1 protocatechuate 3,4-dioxygenase [Rhizobium sp. SL86]
MQNEIQGDGKTFLARRHLLQAAFLLPALALVQRSALAAVRTPEATEGPYYPIPSMRLKDVDNDLVRISGRRHTAEGNILMLTGRVLDSNGQPVSGARVEIWQCDARGRYIHTGEFSFRRRDHGFQGFGFDVTDRRGIYTFRTIEPVVYPGRTPHIHVRVIHGERVLTTQFYIAGHAGNGRDRLFRRLNPAEQQAVSMNLRNGRRSLETVVDIRL